jgi:UDP-glucose:(heptosyl)LPS alpha-1,3-glucosyltransferase
MVAYALEQEFLAAGAHVERFTLEDARGKPTSASRSRLRLAWDVVWFSTVGTLRAKRFLAERPGTVSICHNDVLAGDIYVNHGTLPAAMRARGHYAVRMMRNPLHLFTLLRDTVRYRSRVHRAVVALSTSEADLLRKEYGRVRPAITVIGNGVDLGRFVIPTEHDRKVARERLGIPDGAQVALFIGHEFDRKGLPLVMEALGHARPELVLVVAGGTDDMIAEARAQATRLGVADRIHFSGEQADVSPFLAASDMFVMPSHYESSGLVYLEALASGLPVISSAVGVAADAILDGVNGYLVPLDATVIAERMLAIADADTPWQNQAHESALSYSWDNVARRYLELLESMRSDRDSTTSVG